MHGGAAGGRRQDRRAVVLERVPDSESVSSAAPHGFCLAPTRASEPPGRLSHAACALSRPRIVHWGRAHETGMAGPRPGGTGGRGLASGAQAAREKNTTPSQDRFPLFAATQALPARRAASARRVLAAPRASLSVTSEYKAVTKVKDGRGSAMRKNSACPAAAAAAVGQGRKQPSADAQPLNPNDPHPPPKHTHTHDKKKQGERASMDFRIFMESAKAPGKTISTWHDIPLRNADGTLNFVTEIPMESSAKMEVSTKEGANPIKQDLKKGALRFYPYNINWNYGMLPQTWEDPKHVHPELEVAVRFLFLSFTHFFHSFRLPSSVLSLSPSTLPSHPLTLTPHTHTHTNSSPPPPLPPPPHPPPPLSLSFS